MNKIHPITIDIEETKNKIKTPIEIITDDTVNEKITNDSKNSNNIEYPNQTENIICGLIWIFFLVSICIVYVYFVTVARNYIVNNNVDAMNTTCDFQYTNDTSLKYYYLKQTPSDHYYATQ